MKTVRYHIPKHKFFVAVLPIIRPVVNIVPPEGEDYPQFQFDDNGEIFTAERRAVWKFDIEELQSGIVDCWCQAHTGLNGPDLLKQMHQDREKEMKKAKRIGFFLFKKVDND